MSVAAIEPSAFLRRWSAQFDHSRFQMSNLDMHCFCGMERTQDMLG